MHLGKDYLPIIFSIIIYSETVDMAGLELKFDGLQNSQNYVGFVGLEDLLSLLLQKSISLADSRFHLQTLVVNPKPGAITIFLSFIEKYTGRVYK